MLIVRYLTYQIFAIVFINILLHNTHISPSDIVIITATGAVTAADI